MSDYSDIFGREPEPWREPLGALRLTLAAGPVTAGWLVRARAECEALVKVLNEHPPADQGKPQITKQMVEDGARALAYRLADLDWPGTTVVSAPVRFEHRSGARAVLEAALGKGGA